MGTVAATVMAVVVTTLAVATTVVAMAAVAVAMATTTTNHKSFIYDCHSMWCRWWVLIIITIKTFFTGRKNSLQLGYFAIKIIVTIDLFTINNNYHPHTCFLDISQLQTCKYLLSLVTWYWKIAESENIHTDFFTVSTHRPLIAPYFKRKTSYYNYN